MAEPNPCYPCEHDIFEKRHVRFLPESTISNRDQQAKEAVKKTLDRICWEILCKKTRCKKNTVFLVKFADKYEKRSVEVPDPKDCCVMEHVHPTFFCEQQQKGNPSISIY